MSINDETLRLSRKLRIRVDGDVDEATRALVQAWARSWDEIHEAWSDALMDIAAATKAGEAPSPWLIARSERAQRALLLANAEVASLTDFTGVTVVDAVGRVVEYTPDAELDIMASQWPTQAGTRAEIAGTFNRLDVHAVGAIVERSTEQITSSTRQLGQYTQEQMRRVLVRAVTLGDNPVDAARQMVARAEQTFNGGLGRALVIARTEILDAHRSAAAATQFDNEDTLSGWVWQAELDRRTCPSCWAMHGTEHDLWEIGPNDHQQGRCARLPKTKTWAELGFTDLEEPADVLPDARATFDALPEADRLAIMGRTRLQGLDDGVLALSDLAMRRTNVGWRDSWVPTPVKDLLNAS